MPELRLKGLTSGLQQPFDLLISPGTTITLDGSSGIGKSRLLRAIVDLDNHASGEAWLDDQQRSHLPAHTWRCLVGYLPAESHWWESHVGSHFSIRPDSLFQAVGVDGMLFDAPVNQLSSGEKQRLALIRLLSREPKALLLDEPTANLDKTHTHLVEQLISDYSKRYAVPILWITHDSEQARRVGQRHLHMNDTAIQELQT